MSARPTARRATPSGRAAAASCGWERPACRISAASRRSGGSGRWIGLRRNGDYVVTGIREIPLLAGFLALLLALLPMLFGWRRESQ